MTKLGRVVAFGAVVCVCVLFPLTVYAVLLDSGADVGDD